MKYFVVMLKYLAPPDQVAANVADHRAHLDRGYAQGWLVASGPQNPKTGGVIIARAPGRDYIEKLMDQDPFKTRGIASYEIVEFEPVKRHPELGVFFSG